MFKGVVYSYKSPSNKYYIGRTIHENRRKYTHKWYAENKNSDGIYAFQKAIKKYGFENFEYSVLYRYNSDNREDVLKHINEKEMYYIASFREEGKVLYNIGIGGEGGAPMLGRHFSKESKEKMRIAHLGQRPSEETLRKRRIALKGKRHLTRKELDKMEASRRKNLKKVVQLDLDGKLIKVWKNCPSVDVVSYVALKRCLNAPPLKSGKPRTSGGFRWMYLDDFNELVAYSKA